MKAVVLGGGLGTRLSPLTRLFNKHVLPVYDRPILFYAIDTALKVGLKDVVVVTGPPFGRQVKDLVKLYPKSKSVTFAFAHQPKPLGIPDAIAKTARLVGRDSVMVIPGDNFFPESFRADVTQFKDGALAFLRQVEDPSRFGVPVFKGRKLVDLAEKPKNPPTNWAIIAPWIFDERVFGLIKKLKFSERGELEVVELLKLYLDEGSLRLVKKKGYWKDIGTFDALLEAGRYVQKQKRQG